MRVVIQRVSNASVKVDGEITGQINSGLLVLAGFEESDSSEDLEWMSGKICRMRIFNDDEGIMNKSVQEINGDLLVVSQFTLHASVKKGNRPSYLRAARPEQAVPLYEEFIQCLKKETGKEIQRGIFGADMKVELLNDGPVTIVVDSKNKQ